MECRELPITEYIKFQTRPCEKGYCIGWKVALCCLKCAPSTYDHLILWREEKLPYTCSPPLGLQIPQNLSRIYGFLPCQRPPMNLSCHDNSFRPGDGHWKYSDNKLELSTFHAIWTLWSVLPHVSPLSLFKRIVSGALFLWNYPLSLLLGMVLLTGKQIFQRKWMMDSSKEKHEDFLSQLCNDGSF